MVGFRCRTIVVGFRQRTTVISSKMSGGLQTENDYGGSGQKTTVDGERQQ